MNKLVLITTRLCITSETCSSHSLPPDPKRDPVRSKPLGVCSLFANDYGDDLIVLLELFVDWLCIISPVQYNVGNLNLGKPLAKLI